MTCEICLRSFTPVRSTQILCSKECRYKKKLKQNRWYRPKSNLKIRLACLKHYSNNTMKCQCCGEGHYEFLALDHVNGGGSQERKESGKKGSQGLIRWLLNNNFPVGYRVLCHNCNQSLGTYGHCPHNKIVMP